MVEAEVKLIDDVEDEGDDFVKVEFGGAEMGTKGDGLVVGIVCAVLLAVFSIIIDIVLD